MQNKNVFWALKNAKAKMSDAYVELDIEEQDAAAELKVDIAAVSAMIKKYDPGAGY
jgi:hypothetical protein